jgi:hypothetical protein
LSYLCLGLSKEVLSPINLLVISFSVINYVVRVRVRAGCVDSHFFCIRPSEEKSSGKRKEISPEHPRRMPGAVSFRSALRVRR